VQKHKSVTLTDFVVSQTVTIGERKISPKSDIKKKGFTDSYYSKPNSFYYPDLAVVAVLVQNMLE